MRTPGLYLRSYLQFHNGKIFLIGRKILMVIADGSINFPQGGPAPNKKMHGLIEFRTEYKTIIEPYRQHHPHPKPKGLRVSSTIVHFIKFRIRIFVLLVTRTVIIGGRF